MQAATSCLLLGGPQFLQQQGAVLSAVLTGLIGHVNDRGMLQLLPLMSLVLQLAPQGAPSMPRAAGCTSLCHHLLSTASCSARPQLPLPAPPPV